MIGSTHLENVAALYEAWRNGNFDAAAELLAEDIEWTAPPDSPDTGTAYGVEGIIEALDRFRAEWEQLEVDLVTFEELGDQVMAHFTQRATGRASGIAVHSDLYMLWTFRDGRATRMQAFHHEHEAREAAAEGGAAAA